MPLPECSAGRHDRRAAGPYPNPTTSDKDARFGIPKSDYRIGKTLSDIEVLSKRFPLQEEG